MPTMKTDLELAQAIVRGSEAACAQFVERYRGLCFHLVRRFVDCDADAFDLCQDTFIRALDRMGQYRGESSLAAWVGRVAFNIAQRRLEKTRARREVAWDGENVDDENAPVAADHGIDAVIDAERDAQRLRAAMASLSPTEQAVITLYHLDELSLAEIAAITDLPHGTLKSHLSRGRQRLRRALDAGQPPSGISRQIA
jgi:RNA polymerase sigma factor (sigma-70 family)